MSSRALRTSPEYFIVLYVRSVRVLSVAEFTANFAGRRHEPSKRIALKSFVSLFGRTRLSARAAGFGAVSCRACCVSERLVRPSTCHVSPAKTVCVFVCFSPPLSFSPPLCCCASVIASRTLRLSIGGHRARIWPCGGWRTVRHCGHRQDPHLPRSQGRYRGRSRMSAVWNRVELMWYYDTTVSYRYDHVLSVADVLHSEHLARGRRSARCRMAGNYLLLCGKRACLLYLWISGGGV